MLPCGVCVIFGVGGVGGVFEVPALCVVWMVNVDSLLARCDRLFAVFLSPSFFKSLFPHNPDTHPLTHAFTTRACRKQYVPFLPKEIREIIEKVGVEAALEYELLVTEKYTPSHFMEEATVCAATEGQAWREVGAHIFL